MRTVGEMRYQKKIRAPFKRDSVYKPIERRIREEQKIRIPDGLQRRLPFLLKPKMMKPKTEEQKFAEHGIGIVRSPLEIETHELIKQLSTFNEIRKKKMAEKKIEYDKKMAKLNAPRELDLKIRDKERRRKRYREKAQLAKFRNVKVKRIRVKDK